jgi:hypothetical protein
MIDHLDSCLYAVLEEPGTLWHHHVYALETALTLKHGEEANRTQDSD